MSSITQERTELAPLSAAQRLALGVAADSLVDVCRTMFFIELETPGEPAHLRAQDFAFAGTVNLLHDEGSWELGLYGDRTSCISLARAILGMEADEEPEDGEVVDALGEIVNMVAGSMKTHLGTSASGEIHISSPTFFLGAECLRHQPAAISVPARRFTSTEFEGELWFAWCERSPLALVSEIEALLHGCELGEKQRLVQALATLQELTDVLPSADELLRDGLAACAAVLTDVVNDQPGGDRGLELVHASVVALPELLGGGGDGRELTAVIELTRAGSSEELAAVERDEETVEMLVDFLVESEDGLEQVDATLLGAEESEPGADAVDGLFRVYHTIKGVASFLELAQITKLSHTTETLMDRVRSGDASLSGQVLELVFQSTEALRAQLAALRQAVEGGKEVPPYGAQDDLIGALERAIDGEGVDLVELKRLVAEAGAPAEEEGSKPTKIKETLKIDSELVEQLEAIIGEVHAFGRAIIDGRDSLEGLPDEVRGAVLGMCEASGLLRDVGARIRMVSVGKMFQKMTRMVRDLSKKTEKLTRVVLEGEGTLIPRGMLDGLNDPLVHMVRNAVDHGIEEQAERAGTGKAPLATITLAARSEADRVVVRIAEDGRGLDREKILAKALSKGLVAQDAELNDREVYQLIFSPGFSTAAAVTAISGRGVGMDVVRRSIEGMGGRIEIESELGRGTTFEVVLPVRAED